jgi:Zn-dependent protease
VGFTSFSIRFAAYLAVALFVGMTVREYSRSWMASRLGDQTPRLWGRLTLLPKAWFEPFGSGLLPGLILLLWAASSTFLPPPVAYGKPPPIEPNYLRHQPRDSVLVGFAGPVANMVLAALAGLGVRVVMSGEAFTILVAFELANMCLVFFHLLPIPGLDGARLVALVLPPPAQQTYRNLDRWLPLFALLALFVFANLGVQSIVYSLVNAFCRLYSGLPCGPA